MQNLSARNGVRDLGYAALLAVLVAGLFHAFFGHKYLNLADEGFLWYGVQRTLAGDVPLRDFQSYEPGRYYWCAAFGAFLGDGLLAMRLALAVVQGVAVLLGLLILRRVAPARWLWPLLALVLFFWMFPRHKAFEFAVPTAAVLVAARLIERPCLRRHFVTGLFVGATSFIGRNHAAYGAAGLGALVLYLAWKRPAAGSFERFGGRLLRCLGSFAGGIALGVLPLVAMMLFVPGFARGLWDSVLFFLREGTNLPLPYPFPWALGFEDRGAFERFGLAVAFSLPFVVFPLGLWVALRTSAADLPRRAVAIGATFVGVFYMHHASVRSDPQHLAQAIHPLLLAALALPTALRRSSEDEADRTSPWGPAAVALALAVVTAGVALAAHPSLLWYRPSAKRIPFVALEVGEDQLQVQHGMGGYVDSLRAILRQHVPVEEPLFIAPAWTLFYPLLGKEAPVWQIYYLWPASDETQRALIDELASDGVDHVFIVERTIDNRKELAFRNTNPLVWEHLRGDFVEVDRHRMPTGHYLFRRRER